VFVVLLHTLYIIGLIWVIVVDSGVYIVRSRRSRLELHLDVLKVINEGTVVPTKIMYGANLSWKLLRGILDNMVTQDLIEEIGASGSHSKRSIYRVTPKGDRVLRYFDHAKMLVEMDEPNFNPLQIAR
jgi:predicted transcriptional regulator